MGKYIVTHGQNLYDVALHIYGSIEGVIDLMMNNTSLSLDQTLKAGDELVYTDDYAINKDVAAYYKVNEIMPANGERHVYPKSPTLPRLMDIYIENTRTSIGFVISGSGTIEIDWGDNTDLQIVRLSKQAIELNHFFDNNTGTKRRTCIYGDENARIQKLDISNIKDADIYILKPIYIERFVMKNISTTIEFIALSKGMFEMDCSGSTTGSLLPLLRQKELKSLNLQNIKCSRKAIDEYLIGLVKQHYGRRNCEIAMTTVPSGEYKEPQRDENLNYIVGSGMEAVWVLTHEPAWNEAGAWKFIINDTIYTYTPQNE